MRAKIAGIMQRNGGESVRHPSNSTTRYIVREFLWVNEGQMNRPSKSPKSIGYELERKGTQNARARVARIDKRNHA